MGNLNQNKNKIVFAILGPTATGKTDFAIALSEQYPIDIISVDSAMVYRGMDIGTAKPTSEELMKAPHGLINLRNPDEIYSVADFCQDAKKLIHQSFEACRVPLLVGGTMMYFNALKNGLDRLPQRDEKIREKLTQIIQTQGIESLHELLKIKNPEAALKIKPKDTQRLIRALEIHELSQQGVNAVSWPVTEPLNHPIHAFGLLSEDITWQRDRIAQRFDKMVQQGLIQELEILKSRYVLSADLPSMRCVGYRQAWDYLEGKLSYLEFIERGKIATAQLAKRQRTWLRSFDWVNKVNPKDNFLISICREIDSHLTSRP